MGYILLFLRESGIQIDDLRFGQTYNDEFFEDLIYEENKSNEG